ncbi:expressed protein [Dictyostelium purpureum]|uniref:Expressed protein n=1 Tax=Dictyostelium purpureum TaxID=5786 RepID=F0ZZJ2_DICPU|nr:uncharacterized protein DICPUDRAFT_92939 [Dictyostelium purpureum]EGC30634.1 expressed protein [Dictyostelium purpureum]|eukprot:XP_003292840.1 expressed protein [Dictyostelium purpureum]
MNKVMPRSFSPRTFMGDHGINISDCSIIKVEKIVAPKPWKPSHSRSTSTNSKFVEESLFEAAGNEIQTIILHSLNTYDNDSSSPLEQLESAANNYSTNSNNNNNNNNSSSGGIVRPNLVKPKIVNNSVVGSSSLVNTTNTASITPIVSPSLSNPSSPSNYKQTCNISNSNNNDNNIKIASKVDSLTSSLQGAQFENNNKTTCTFNNITYSSTTTSDEDSSSLYIKSTYNSKLFYFENYVIDSTLVQDSLNVKNPFFNSSNSSSSPCMVIEPLTPPTRTHNPITLNQAFTENDIVHGAELGLLSISPPPQSYCTKHLKSSPSSNSTTTVLF